MSKIVITIEDSPNGVLIGFTPTMEVIASRIENDKETSADMYTFAAFKAMTALHELLLSQRQEGKPH